MEGREPLNDGRRGREERQRGKLSGSMLDCLELEWSMAVKSQHV